MHFDLYIYYIIYWINVSLNTFFIFYQLSSKIKIKYNIIKVILYMNNIFDLQNININFSQNVQKNLEILYEQYGKEFKIKYNDLVLDVVLQEVTYSTNEFTVWLLRTKEQIAENYGFYVFCIHFIDIKNMIKNNESYIANIHKSEKASGSDVVKFVLKLNEKLGVTKTYLHDGAQIDCKNNKYYLSLIKLLEKKETFYMKFGFKPIIFIPDYTLASFLSQEKLYSKLDDIIDEIRKIKISDVIEEYTETKKLLEIIKKEENKKEMEIILTSGFLNENYSLYSKKEPYNSIDELLTECDTMINLLKKSKEKYLYLHLINIFKDKEQCVEYDSFSKYILDSQRYKIIYGAQEITNKYLYLFSLLPIFMFRKYYYEFEANKKNDTKHIYIMRHGETDWNKEKKHQGCEADIPLNNTGKEQARKTGLYFKQYRLPKHNIDCIWTSPLSRAKETAEIIKNIINPEINVKVYAELKESKSGKNSGLTKMEEPRKTFIGKYEEFVKKTTNIEIAEQMIEFGTKLDEELKIGGESYESLVNRCNKMIDEIKNSTCQNILIVSHSGYLDTFIPLMYNISENLSGGGNCSISYHQYDMTNDKFKMIASPSNDHLEKLNLIGGNDIWNNMKIIKSLGKGQGGETFLIELNNKRYALKRHKILENEKESFNDEIHFFEWIKKLDENNKKFFMQLYHYRLDDNCDFNFIPRSGNINDTYAKSKLCFDMILELKENTIDKIINKLSKKQVISAFIQLVYAIYLMQKSGYYHQDTKTNNIAYNKFNDNKIIKIGKFGDIQTFGYQYSLIDYGSVLNKNANLDEYSKKQLEAYKYFNGDLITMIDYLLLKNEEIYSQIQENKLHLKSKEAYDFFSNIPKNKFNKIKKFMEEKINIDYIDKIQALNYDDAKKEPKYMFALHQAIQIYRIKYPKSFTKSLGNQFNVNIDNNKILFDKKELLYIIKNQNNLHKIIKHFSKTL
jgi:broad specificity phosphatase PhoE